MPKTDNVRQVDLPRATGGGSVYIRSGSSGGVSNADTVDGYHASSTATAGKLLALDASAQFNPSVIEWADVAGAGLGASGDTLVVQWGTTPTTIQPDDAANGGSATTAARADHRHAITAAAPGTIQPDHTASEGTSTSFARADHRHAIAAAAPGTIQPDATASEGSSTSFARADHQHAIAAAAPTASLTYASTNSEGSSTSFARADHGHAITAYADASVYPQHLLKTDASGYLKLVRLTATDRLRTSLVDSETGTNLKLAPAQDLDLQPGGTKRVRALTGVRLQADNYASQTTGWAVAYSGAADFRYVYTDELHAKAFIADLEQALAGGQIISKSVAPLSRNFTAPAAGATADLWVECFQGFPTAQVFAAGDYVMVRTFDRSGGGLSITNCFGTVSAPYFPSPQSDPPEQRWTFTRLSGTVGGHPAAGYMGTGQVVRRGTLALDFGVSGNGYHEVNAIDGLMAENSPYNQTVKWATHPWYDRTVTTRTGNLKGIFNVAGEYGLYAGMGVTDASQFLRISNQAVEAHNLPVKLYDGSNVAIMLQPAASPYMAMGVPIPTGWLTQSGWWAGKSGGVYRQYLGTVSGGDIAAGLKWDGTTLTVKGQIYVTGGDAAKTDLSNVAANTVVGKVNTTGATLIQPGRILISGSTTLDGWRYGDTTYIDGGDIYAGTVTASKMTVTMMNMVDNPGFESGTVGWQLLAGSSIGTWGGRSGNNLLVGDGNRASGANYALSDNIPVYAGQVYYAEIWCYVSTGSRDTGMTVSWRDRDGAHISYSDCHGATGTGWTRHSRLITAPANAAFAVLILAQWGTPNAAAPRWDDVVFRPASGMNLLVGTPGGARVEINNAGIEGYSDASTKQFYLRTSDGRGMFGGGKGVLDASGIMLSGSETSYATYNAVRWLDGTLPAGDEVARVSAGLFVRDSGDTADVPAVRIVSDPAGDYGYSELELCNQPLTDTYRQRLLFFTGTEETMFGTYNSGIKLEIVNTGAGETGAEIHMSCGPGDFAAPASIAFSTSGTARLTVNAGGASLNGGLILGSGGTLTIASGAITVTHANHIVDTEGSAASDDLDTINGGATGDILILHSTTYTRVVTLKDGTGNLRLAGDFALGDNTDSIMLMYWNSNWNEISRSNN